ncbi:hypothetical protein [Novosphingobium sp.]|uniref:hypothetical protein n=1 Tax=Novosphingobium sp. TaxID=1874826 RepID=UPI0035B4A137
MSFLKNANPAGALADFRQVYRDAGPGRWKYALLAALTTAGIFSSMVGESWKKQRKLPEITYITSWPADRTEAETKAFIAENQKRKEAQAELERRYNEEGQKLWMDVGRATGLDVNDMKRKADADKAKADAAAKARADAVLKQSNIATSDSGKSAKPGTGE